MKQFELIYFYDEYIELFKIACEENGKVLTRAQLRQHCFDLPSASYFITNCPDKQVKTYNSFLKWAGLEINHPRPKYTYEMVYEEFRKRGLTLVDEEYKNSRIKMKYICDKHPHIIQEKSFNDLLFGRGSKLGGCPYCHLEDCKGEKSHAWKGGTSSLNAYLRENIDEWKKESMWNCNYKCVITGKKFSDIHHLYSMSNIIKEIELNLSIKLDKNINEYTIEELELIKAENIRLHNKYPLGVCLSREVHNLFHRRYGDDNTPEQFEEFINNYSNIKSEIDISLTENKKQRKPIKSKYQFNVYKEADNSFVMTSFNQCECGRQLNIDYSEIGRCLNNKKKSYKGYLFYRIENDPNLK